MEVAAVAYVVPADIPAIVALRGSKDHSFFGIAVPSLTTGEITVVLEPGVSALVALDLLSSEPADLAAR